jgi:hypothetical protein
LNINTDETNNNNTTTIINNNTITITNMSISNSSNNNNNNNKNSKNATINKDAKINNNNHVNNNNNINNNINIHIPTLETYFSNNDDILNSKIQNEFEKFKNDMLKLYTDNNNNNYYNNNDSNRNYKLFLEDAPSLHEKNLRKLKIKQVVDVSCILYYCIHYDNIKSFSSYIITIIY